MPSFGSATQGIALGNMIVKIVGDSSDLDKALKNTKKLMADLGSAINDAAKQVDRSVTAVFTAAAASVTAIGVAAISTGAQFEAGMARVQAVSGATADQMAALTDQAREIGKTTQFSAKDAADAMYVLSQAGLDVNQVLKATNDVMILAAGSGVDLDTAAGMVAATLTTFNLSAEQSGRIVDVMTMAANKSLLSMQDLSVAMQYGGTAGASFGLSLESTVAAIASFRDLGLKASVAGTSLRTALVRLADPPKQARKVLDDLGLTLKQVDPQVVGFDGGMKALAAAGITARQSMDLFGKVSGASINLLIQKFRDGTDGFEDLKHSLENSAGSAGLIFEKMQATVSGQFQILKNKVSDILITLFQDAGPALMRLIDGLQRRVGVLASYVNGNSKEIGNGVDKLVDGILRLTDDLILMLPRVKEIGAALLVVFAVAKVYEFIAAIAALTDALGANLVRAIGLVIAEMFALDAAMAFLVVTTGAGALIVGVGALIALIAKLTDKLTGAADEAQKLAIGLKAAGLIKESEDKEAARLQKLIDLQKADNAARAQAGLRVSDQAQAIAELTGQQALQEIQAGRMVEIQDKLYASGKAPILVLQQQAAELQMTAGAYQDTAAKAQGFVDVLNKQGFAAQATGDTTRQFAVMSKQLGVTVTSYEDVVAVQQEYTTRAKQATDQSQKLQEAITKQQIAANDAAKNAKKNGGALDDEDEADKKAQKRLEDLTKATEDMAAQGDKGREAFLKLTRALDKLQDAEAAGVDGVEIMKARTKAWDEFYASVDQTVQTFLTVEQAAGLTFKGIQNVSDGIDELTSSRLVNLSAQLSEAENQTGKWEKTLGTLGTKLTGFFKIGGKDGQQLVDAFKNVGKSADDFFGQLLGGGGTSGVLAAATGGIGALAEAAGVGLEVAFKAFLMTGGQAFLDWLKAFPSVIGDVLKALTDLTSVLALADIFTNSTQSLKDWNQQVADAQALLTTSHNQIDAFSYSLDYASGLPLSSFNGKTKKDRQKAKDEYLASIRDSLGGAEQNAADTSQNLTNLNANKPKGPAAAEAQAVADRVDWVIGFVKALPKMLNALLRELPKLFAAMATGLPKTLNRLARAATPLLRELTDSLATLLQHSAPIIHAFTALAEAFMFALVYALPTLTEALVGAAPMIITALIQDLPRLMFELAYALPFAILAGFIAALPKMVRQIKTGLKDAIGYLADHWVSIVTLGLSDLFTGGGKNGGKSGDDGLWSAFGKWIGDVLHPHRHARGMQYVPHTMATVLEPGESVFDRAATAAMAKGTYYPPAPMTASGGMSPLVAELLVALDGQVVDAAQYRSMARGHMPKMQRAIRSGRGTKVGYTPGRGSFFD
jgi:TP901 family phage tail tape measure protein